MKVRILLSSCVFLLFMLLAGGSFSGSDLKMFFWIFVGVLGFGLVWIIIKAIVESNNKQTRLDMIAKDEAENNDFDHSVSFGDDRCKFYFDAEKRQVMIMRVMTEGITKYFVDNFEYSGPEYCQVFNPYFCFYDRENRQMLAGNYVGTPDYRVKKIVAENKTKTIIPESDIPPRIVSNVITKGDGLPATTEIVWTLVDENYGLVTTVRKGQISYVSSYVAAENIQRKTGTQSYVSDKAIGNYHFIMDDFFDVLVIVTPTSHEVLKYSDIIEVSYEENSTKLYSKSAMRTVGGAVVGSALMGGAGAIVGGMSGDLKSNLEIKTMQIKLLLRDTKRTSLVLEFKDFDGVLKTKETAAQKLYEKFLENAKLAKDTLSIIIDKAKTSAAPVQQVEQISSVSPSGVADELAKLAQLKAAGILTEEEFNAQKAKLLNS